MHIPIHLATLADIHVARLPLHFLSQIELKKIITLLCSGAALIMFVVRGTYVRERKREQ